MDLRILENGTAFPGGGCQSRSCPASEDNFLPQAIQRRIADHPCYSDRAHHSFARMHLAVAPACNIQCNYCNRKFDCANESRPGVVSEVLSPVDAARKAKAVAARISRLSVVGIAGPGDPLANPGRTFETLRRVREDLPHVKPCLSTNGLRIGAHLDEIVALGIDHVTITINAIDPAIGALIYPWIIWEGCRISGRPAAEILIREQLAGLEALVARGVLVKVNSVMIPGVNDDHLPEVSRAIRARGAFLHNIMPLISRPEHGTAFGLAGQREPTAAELRSVQEACGTDMRIMRHCRQCRADAIGMLGEDRSQDFTMDKVSEMEKQDAGALVAVATRDGQFVDTHFGQAQTFRLFELEGGSARAVGSREVPPYCHGPDDCGEEEAEDRMDRVLEALAGCKAVLCARIGREPRSRLKAAGIHPNTEHAWDSVSTAVESVGRWLNKNTGDRP